MFSSRLTLQGELCSSGMAFTKTKRANGGSVGASRKNGSGHVDCQSAFEPAARDEQHDVAAAVAGVGVRVRRSSTKSGQACSCPGQAGLGAMNSRVVRRQRRGDNFKEADAGASASGPTAVDARRWRRAPGDSKTDGLFDGTAQLAQSDDFTDVSHAAPEFLFRPGAAGREQGSKGNRR